MNLVSASSNNYFQLILLFAGRFLLNNYKQALSIIKNYQPEIEAFKAAHGLNDEDFLHWCREEYEYLLSCAKESVADTMNVAYVEALAQLDRAK